MQERIYFAFMKINIMTPPKKPININSNEAHLWLLKDQSVVDKALLTQYMSSLNTVERIKQTKFYFEKHRHQYLVTRGIVRHILSLYDATIPPYEWCFSTNKYGRPYIENSDLSTRLYFNLSHTENMIALVISHVEKLGVDVEWMLRKGQTLELAESFFTQLEVRELKNLPKTEQVGRFYTLWTLKEAYIKACGKGLSIPLDAFSFYFSGRKIDITFSSEYVDDPSNWLFWQFLPHPDYKLSLAMGEAADIGGGFNLSIYELIDGQNALSR